MKINLLARYAIVILIAALFQCSEKPKKESDVIDIDNNEKSQPADPCKILFDRLINMPNGLTAFKNASFSNNDYLYLKDEFPDIERYYQLSRQIREGTIDPKIADPIANGGQFNDINFFLQLYRYEKENSSDKLREEIDLLTEDEFNSTKKYALDNGWIWKDITYNDCQVSDYYRKHQGNKGIYEYANQSFILPNIKIIELHLVINGNDFPILYYVVQTKTGWKPVPQILNYSNAL